MLNIDLNIINVVFAILLTLVLAVILINIKRTKEGFIFNIKLLETSCKKKKKKPIPRLTISIPICSDVIIPTKNNPLQKTFIKEITNTVSVPEISLKKIEDIIPIELILFKDSIINIVKLSIVKSLYTTEDDIQKNLEILIANTLYDIEKPGLIKKAPFIKKFLESIEIQNIIKPVQNEIKDATKVKILQNIIKNKELINKPTIPLRPDEIKAINTTFTSFSQRCGISLI